MLAQRFRTRSWDMAHGKPVVTEQALLTIINDKLRKIGASRAPMVHALRPSEARGLNWKVASFDLKASHPLERRSHLDMLSITLMSASDYDVAWQSTSCQ